MDKEQRERIISQTLASFIRDGVRAVTMDAVAVSSGISKRTLYEQFGDKEQQLLACLTYMWEQEYEQLQAYAADGTHNVLEVILYAFNRKLETFRHMHPDFRQEIMRYPKIKKMIRVYHTVSSKDFITALKTGVAEGLIRDDIRFELLGEFLSIQFRFFHEENFWKKYAPNEVFRMILLLWLRGIATEKGCSLIDSFLKDGMTR